MTVLRQRMIDDLHLRGYAERTGEAYVAAVGRVAQHYHSAPDHLDEAQLRGYLLYLTRERKLARASFTQTLCGLRFCSEHTLGRQWTILEVTRPLRRRGVEPLSPFLFRTASSIRPAKSIAAAADSMRMAARTSEPFAGIQRAPCAR